MTIMCCLLNKYIYSLSPSHTQHLLYLCKIYVSTPLSPSIFLGMICMEMLKYLQKGKPLARFVNTFNNLALPMFTRLVRILRVYCLLCILCAVYIPYYLILQVLSKYTYVIHYTHIFPILYSIPYSHILMLIPTHLLLLIHSYMPILSNIVPSPTLQKRTKP